MADYKEIGGIKIQTIAGNPSVSVAGQLWYNSTTAQFKGNIYYNGVWTTSSATMNNGRKSVGSAGSSSNDGVVAAGITLNGSQSNQNATETFDGSAWSNANTVNTTRRGLGSAGISGTAALIFGGYLDPYTGASEKWDGTNWTTTPSLNSNRDNIGGGGTSTSALAIAGQQGVSITAEVESWNGSSWTTGTSNPNVERLWISAAGKSNSDVLAWAGMSYSGGYSSYTTCYLWDGPDTTTEIWDGTSWTAGNPLNTAQTQGGSNGSGPSNTAAWYAGGTAPAFTSPGDEGWTGTQIYNFGADTVTLAPA